MTTGRSIVTGLAIAAAGMLTTTLLMGLAGAAHLDGAGLDVGVLLLGLVVFALAGLAEELLFRLLLLGTLVRRTGRPGLSLAVMAVVTGAFHLLTTAHTTVLSLVSSTLGGVMYGVAYLRTGRIWLGLGVHVGWNWFQGTILGLAVSGTDDYSGAVLQVHTSGDAWLSGAAYGPEGSALSLVGRLVVVALVLIVTARAGARGLRPPQSVAASS